MAAKQDTEEKKAPQKKGRSTIGFPYEDLDEAVNIAKGIFGVSGNGACESNQLAAKVGLSAKSSGFRGRIYAARTFGLITAAGKDHQLTELGKMMVDASKEAHARVEAFLTVPLYKKIFEEYDGSPLPGNPVLEKQMVDFGVSENQADRARQVFHRSAQQAGFFKLGGSSKLIKPPTRQSGGAGAAEPAGENPPPPPPPESTLDPLIQGLIDRLPEAGVSWTTAERVKWLQTLAQNFDMVYEDGGEITVEAKHEPPRGSGKLYADSGS